VTGGHDGWAESLGSRGEEKLIDIYTPRPPDVTVRLTKAEGAGRVRVLVRAKLTTCRKSEGDDSVH